MSLYGILPRVNTLAQWDWLLFDRVNQGLVTSSLDQIAILLSSNLTWWIVVGLVFTGSVLLRKTRLMKAMVIAGLSLGAADALNTYALKPAFGRLRPCHQKTVRLPTGNCGSQFGMPSNHAGNGAAFLVALRFFLTPLSTAIVASAVVAVGWSRIYLGVHFPTDILAGFLVGGVVGGAVAWILIRTSTYISNRPKNDAPH